MLDKYLPILVIGTALIAFVVIVIKNWRWLPVILLPIMFYVPRQAVPNGLLENFIIVRWLTSILIPGILIIQLIKMLASHQRFKMTPVAVPLLIFIVYYMACGIINNTGIIDIAGSLVLYVRYPLLLIIFVNLDIDDKVMKTFLILFFIFMVLQIPECILRYLLLGVRGDRISMSLGPWGAFDLGVYSIYSIALVIAYNSVKGIKITHLIFCVFLFIIAMLGEIKAFIISIPIIAIAIIYFSGQNQQMRKRILSIALPIFLFFVAFYIYSIWGSVQKDSKSAFGFYINKIVNVITNPGVLLESQQLDTQSSRVFGLAFVWDYLKNKPINLLFGVGPGSMLAGNFSGQPGKIYDVPQYLNQVSIILGELGIIGFVLYLIFLITLLFLFIQVTKSSKNPTVNIIGSALIGMWIYYTFLGPFYDLVWRHDSPNFVFYTLSAYIISRIYKKNNEMII